MNAKLSVKEKSFLEDFEKLWEKYKIPERNDVFWESYIKDTQKIATLYEHEPFGQIVVPMLVELMSLQQKGQCQSLVLKKEVLSDV